MTDNPVETGNVMRTQRDREPRHRTTSRRIGSGQRAATLHERSLAWPSLALETARQAIHRPTDWSVRSDRHTVIVHLAGRIDFLETELDGDLGGIGPALPGEIWIIPAGRNYASHAVGGVIDYAVLSIPAAAPELDSPWDHHHAPARTLGGIRDDSIHTETRRLITLALADDPLAELKADELSARITHRLSFNAGLAASFHRGPELSLVQIRNLHEFILEHLGERINLALLAGLAGMTTHHLLIAFRRAFGTTPAQFVLNQRLRRAQWLLLHTRSDITSIALRSGFSSHSHLTTLFTDRLGSPPRDYRTRFGNL